VSERNYQVTRMTHIYESAAGVYAYLPIAMGSRESDLVASAIQTLQKIVADHNASGRPIHELVSTVHQRHSLLGGALEEEMETWNALGRFLNQDWWRRAWVLQEATAVKQTTILYGGHEISWFDSEFLVLAIFAFVTHPEVGPSIKELMALRDPSLGPQNGLLALRLKRVRKVKLSLLEVLQTLRPLAASDLRDKVYAGLGLVHDVSTAEVPLDYGVTTGTVYFHVAAHLVQNNRHLDWLEHVSSHHSELPFPSWIPIWAIPYHRSPMPKRIKGTADSEESVYHADLNLESNDSESGAANPLATIQGAALSLRGVDFDEIISVTPGAGGGSDTSAERAWMPANCSDTYQATGETIHSAFFRCLTLDVAEVRGTEVVRGAAQVPLPPPLGDDSFWDRSRYEFGAHPMKMWTPMRSLAISRQGYMALVPEETAIGDRVVVLVGGCVPYVLRPVGNDTQEGYRYVGEAYVHGLMDGETARFIGSGVCKVQEIKLV